MANTRNALQSISANVDESMGVRTVEHAPSLGPAPSPKDVGRRPLRKFARVAVDQILLDPNQPREEFDDQEIQRLASSIRNTGQLHPIRVRWHADREKWMIVTGERRYRATLAAGLREIDCFFHEDELTESEILEQQLVENLLRQDLKPLEEARGYASLMEVNDWNGKQVAEALRVSPSKVSRALALLDLPESVQSRIAAGDLPKSSAYELSKLDNPDVQSGLATGELTQRKTSQAVRKRRGKPVRKPAGIQQTFVSENGFKVTVRANRQGNYHEIEAALEQALEEVRHRINNNMQLF